MSITAYLVQWDEFVAAFQERYGKDSAFLYRAIEDDEPWLEECEAWTDSPATAWVASEAYGGIRRRLAESERRVADQLLGALFWRQDGTPAWIRDLDFEADGEVFAITMKPATVREYARLAAPETLAALRAGFDAFWQPFQAVVPDPTWLTGPVVRLAQAIDQDRDFDRLPLLADALEEAGCTHADVLTHCRSGDEEHLGFVHEHVDGCWVVDLLLRRPYDPQRERAASHYDDRIPDADTFLAYVSMWTDWLHEAAGQDQGLVVSWHGT